MKEKILKLIDACVEDKEIVMNKISMSERTNQFYCNAMKETSNEIRYKGKNIYRYDDFSFKHTDIITDKYADSYYINIHFDKQPDIKIYTTPNFIEEKVYQIDGSMGKYKFWSKWKNVKLDVHEQCYSITYKLQYGRHTFDISKDEVVRIHDTIRENREKIELSRDEDSLNERLKQFNIEV